MCPESDTSLEGSWTSLPYSSLESDVDRGCTAAPPKLVCLSGLPAFEPFYCRDPYHDPCLSHGLVLTLCLAPFTYP